MSEIRTFFRFCPECGRRFHIKLTSKKLVDFKRETEQINRPVVLNPAAAYSNPAASYPYASGATSIIVQEGEPITVDIEEFQYMYKCKHCGHEWSEKHIEENKE